MDIKNDQGHIIEAIIEGNYNYVWEQVKYIGYQDESSPEIRYLIFQRAFHDFNPNINNNFIHFYKRYLKFLKDEPTYFTDKRNYKKAIDDLYSPNEKTSKFIKSLKDISW